MEGRLQSRDWETQDGQKRSTTEVVADNIQFLRMGPKAGGPGAGKSPSPEEEIATIDLNNEMPPDLDKKSGEAPQSKPNEEVPF